MYIMPTCGPLWEVSRAVSRPVLIIQNDIGNRHSPTVICAAITSRMNKAKLPTHIEIEASAYGIVRDSVILLEQLPGRSIREG